MADHHGSLALTNGAALFAAVGFGWCYLCLTKQVEKRQKQYQSEKSARDSMEKELRGIVHGQLHTDDGDYLAIVGTVHSCFVDCVGTPRQGHLAPSTRAKIVFVPKISPTALDDLRSFSHVWIIFKFHLNTNTAKASRAYSGARTNGKGFTFPAKVHPPVLREDNRRVSVFATRSPHRPNPIGITLARIETVDSNRRCVHLRGIDLVDGTPVYDVKPYVPAYDTMSDVKVADWIESNLPVRNHVYVHDRARQSALRLGHKMKLFKGEPEEFLKALIEALSADVRSPTQMERALTYSTQELVFDGLVACLRFTCDDRSMDTSVELEDIRMHSAVQTQDVSSEDYALHGMQCDGGRTCSVGDCS